ncbi:MAG: U32 family peptidase [Ruminococcaceae bacterium]|nr:U32 family peptidase [Oscillospiraceae bacterium]
MEILSPAGNFESLQAAVHYGADAVYVGGSRFSARKSAQNFTDDELCKAVDFCHARGVKLYLCCNTLLKEEELSNAMEFIRYGYQIGVDALIIQDLGLLECVRQALPDMPIHASTQMTITNSAAVKTLKKLGVHRVVLAREVTAGELEEIRKQTDMELEYFVHGALCISYSGQCLMSSLLGGRSGNRGGCAQPCRLPYTLLRNGKPVTETKPLLCPKDLCLAQRVQELSAMGIASLKIEGRMKSPAYVAMVTQIYKQAAEGSISHEDVQNMLKFFSRGGSCEGYYSGCTYDGMMDTTDKAKIAGELPVLEKKIKTAPVILSASAITGKPLLLTMATHSGETITVSGELCQRAIKSPTTKERIEQQLSKLGGTPFHAEKVTVLASPDVAVSVGELNALRRKGAEQLENLVVQKFKRELPPQQVSYAKPISRVHMPTLCCDVHTEEQLRAVVDMGIGRVYVPDHLWSKAGTAEEPILLLPPLSKEGQGISVAHAERVCIQNLGQLLSCRGKDIVAGHRLNVTNSHSATLLAELGIRRIVLSPELNMQAICQLRRKTEVDLEVIAYGRLPLMLLKNCIIKSTYACDCGNGHYALRDRKNEIFPILPRHCGNVIYNSKPVYMADRIDEMSKMQIDGLRLSFTLENYETCCNVIKEYQEALGGKTKKRPTYDFTRGHFYRGME